MCRIRNIGLVGAAVWTMLFALPVTADALGGEAAQARVDQIKRQIAEKAAATEQAEAATSSVSSPPAEPSSGHLRTLEIQRLLKEKRQEKGVAAESGAVAEPAPVPATTGAQHRMQEIQRKLMEKGLTAAPAAVPAPQAPVARPEAAASDAQRKLGFMRMMLEGKGAQRIESSGHAEAVALLNQARQKYEAAVVSQQEQQDETAIVQVDDALKLYNSASRLVPSASVVAQHKAKYEEHQRQLEAARQSHRNNYDRRKRAGGSVVDYDHAELQRLEQAAKSAADKANYEQAAARLNDGQNLVQHAIRSMLNEQTIVYELDLSTPEKEYGYEHNRYLGYEELIPVAFERRLPSEEEKLQIHAILDKAKWMAGEAEKTAKKGDYSTAIRMMLDAINEIKQAFRIMGVNQ